jgi:hypothetical protein
MNVHAHPSVETMLSQLPDAGDALSSALADFARDPQPDKAEILAARLSGVARVVMNVRAALLAQSRPQPPIAA